MSRGCLTRLGPLWDIASTTLGIASASSNLPVQCKALPMHVEIASAVLVGLVLD